MKQLEGLRGEDVSALVKALATLPFPQVDRILGVTSARKPKQTK